MKKRNKKPTATDPLIGQALVYMGDPTHRRHHIGYRAGRIRAVTRDRATGRVKRIVIEDQSALAARPGRPAQAGARVRLWPNEWNHDQRCGIQRYKVIRPVDETDAMLREKRSATNPQQTETTP